MRHLLIAVVLVPFILAACSTSNFLGLSKAKYVEETNEQLQTRMTDVENTLKETRTVGRQDIDELQAQIAGLVALQGQLEDLVAAMEETNRTNEELQDLAAALQVRVDGLSKETLQEMIIVLDEYLRAAEAEAEGDTAEEPAVDVEGSETDGTAESGESEGE